MKVILVLLLIATATSEPCKWRKNYIYFETSGEDNIHGLNPVEAKNCIQRGMSVYQKSISGLH